MPVYAKDFHDGKSGILKFQAETISISNISKTIEFLDMVLITLFKELIQGYIVLKFEACSSNSLEVMVL